MVITVGLDHAWTLTQMYAETVVLWVVCVLLIVWAIFTARAIRRRDKENELRLREFKLRGNKMTKGQRKRWLQQYKSDRVYDTFSKDFAQGIISHAEMNMIFRQLSTELKLPDLKTQKLMNMVEVVKPTNAFKNYPATETILKQHLALVKAAINRRVHSWRLSQLLYKPVSIPGPPVGSEVKAKVLKKKGALFGRTKAA